MLLFDLQRSAALSVVELRAVWKFVADHLSQCASRSDKNVLSIPVLRLASSLVAYGHLTLPAATGEIVAWLCACYAVSDRLVLQRARARPELRPLRLGLATRAWRPV